MALVPPCLGEPYRWLREECEVAPRLGIKALRRSEDRAPALRWRDSRRPHPQDGLLAGLSKQRHLAEIINAELR